jgi:hypothetical protein
MENGLSIELQLFLAAAIPVPQQCWMTRKLAVLALSEIQKK